MASKPRHAEHTGDAFLIPMGDKIPSVAGDDTSPEDAAAHKFDGLHDCLKLLPPGERLAIEWWFDGKTQEQIAAAEGVSQAAISQRITKAIPRLRKLLAERGIEWDGRQLKGVVPRAATYTKPSSMKQTASNSTKHPTILSQSRIEKLRRYIVAHNVTVAARALGLAREAVAKLAAGLPAAPGSVAIAGPAVDALPEPES